MKFMSISRSSIIRNRSLCLVIAALVAVSGFIFTAQVSAETPPTATIEEIYWDISPSSSPSTSLKEWMDSRFAGMQPPSLELRINDTGPLALNENYSFDKPIPIEKPIPAAGEPEEIEFHLRRTGTDEEYKWQNIGYKQRFFDGSRSITVIIASATLESIVNAGPEPNTVLPQTSDEEKPPPADQKSGSQYGTQVSSLADIVSQLNDRLTTLNDRLTTETGTVDELREESTGIIADLKMESTGIIADLKMESTTNIDDIKKEIRLLNLDLERAVRKAGAQTGRSWTAYALAGLIVVILIAAAALLLKRYSSKPGTPEPEPVAIWEDKESESESTSGPTVSYESDGAPLDEATEVIRDIFTGNFQDQRRWHAARARIAEHLARIGNLTGDIQTLESEKRDLESTVNKAKPYLDRQEGLSTIKSDYKMLQSTLIPLIETSGAAKALISGIVGHPIDSHDEYDRVAERMELLKGLETALTGYLTLLDETVERSAELAEEIERANAAKQVAFVKQLIDGRRIDSLTVIPEILEDIRENIERTEVEERIFSDIAAYRQHLGQHPANVRVVPLSIIDLLERLCREAQSGQVEAIERLAEATIQALKPVYGTP